MASKGKKKLSFFQSKQVMPAIDEFNLMSRSFIKLLNKKIEQKNKRISKIAFMVNEMAIPVNTTNISVQTYDMNRTIVKKKGESSFNKKMDWEDSFRSRRRGLIL